MVDRRNVPVEDLIRSQLQSEEEFTDQCFSRFKPPCIMCVQYCGGAQYRGVFSTMGDIMSSVGDILSTMGVFSTVGIS